MKIQNHSSLMKDCKYLANQQIQNDLWSITNYNLNTSIL